jgi:hypothetical protein
MPSAQQKLPGIEASAGLWAIMSLNPAEASTPELESNGVQLDLKSGL